MTSTNRRAIRESAKSNRRVAKRRMPHRTTVPATLAFGRSAEVYAVVTDFPSYARLFPEFKQARVVSTTGNVVRVEFRAEVVLAVRYVLDLACDPGPLTVDWTFVEGEIVTMTIWLRHQDILYYYDGASSATGFGIAASYAAFAHVVETAAECRYVFFGGSSDFRDELTDGLAVFKRGFSNSEAPSYLCSAPVARRQPR